MTCLAIFAIMALACGVQAKFDGMDFRYWPQSVPQDYPDVAYDEVQGPVSGLQSRDDMMMNHEFQHRVPEFLDPHPPLWGHQYVQGGAGEGEQRLKPDGSLKNMQVIKTDAVLPAYCNPPNPCPLGYTEEDGCVEDFVNTAAFSRDYQAGQDCMCDSEHMFQCQAGQNGEDQQGGGQADEESQLETLARSISNEGLTDVALNKLDSMEEAHESKPAAGNRMMAKKFNPYISGDKLPVVAKKSHDTSMG